MKRNQELLVQVVKDEIGTKGAALSTYISLPGRYLVYMPQAHQVLPRVARLMAAHGLQGAVHHRH